LYYTLRVIIELTLILFLLPSFASAAITKEREQQTWNALLLSRLTSWEIVLGKFVGALAPALFLLLLFLPLDIISAVLGDVSLFRFLLSTGLLLSIVVFCTALGLFFSWARRRTFQASSSVFGVLAFLTVGTWILFGLYQLSQIMRPVSAEEFPPLWLNPYLALNDSLDTNNAFPFVAIIALILYLVLSAALLWLVTTRLRHGAKELEQ
jgi:ABC-type transport system involved in multi-copper enzyme maturation permease subunit